MKLSFTDNEQALINGLGLLFDPYGDLTEEEFCVLWDAIAAEAGFGTEESDRYGDILANIVEQEERGN